MTYTYITQCNNKYTCIYAPVMIVIGGDNARSELVSLYAGGGGTERGKRNAGEAVLAAVMISLLFLYVLPVFLIIRGIIMVTTQPCKSLLSTLRHECFFLFLLLRRTPFLV